MSTFQIGGVKPRSATQETALTDAGAEWILKLLAQEGKSPAQHGLRIAVLGGGCSGFRYDIRWDTARPDDVVVRHANGACAYIDPRSHALIAGSRIDYMARLQGAGFTVVNPNATGTCGCGESFSA